MLSKALPWWVCATVHLSQLVLHACVLPKSIAGQEARAAGLRDGEDGEVAPVARQMVTSYPYPTGYPVRKVMMHWLMRRCMRHEGKDSSQNGPHNSQPLRPCTTRSSDNIECCCRCFQPCQLCLCSCPCHKCGLVRLRQACPGKGVVLGVGTACVHAAAAARWCCDAGCCLCRLCGGSGSSGCCTAT